MPRTFRRALITASLALTALIGLTSSAAASRSLGLTPAGSFSMTSQGLVSLSMPNGMGGRVDIHCTSTLSGTLSRSVAKRSGSQLGQITGATFGPSAGNRCHDLGAGLETIVQPSALPWNMAYTSFSGSLPRPTLVQFLVQGATITLNLPSAVPPYACTFTGDIPLSLGFAGNVSGLVRPLRHTMGLASGGAMCFRSAQLVGAYSITPRQTLILID